MFQTMEISEKSFVKKKGTPRSNRDLLIIQIAMGLFIAVPFVIAWWFGAFAF